jgi:hypothetical protein
MPDIVPVLGGPERGPAGRQRRRGPLRATGAKGAAPATSQRTRMTAAVAAHIGARNRIVGAEALHAIGDIRGAGLIATRIAWRRCVAWYRCVARRGQRATGVPTITIAVTWGVIVVVGPPTPPLHGLDRERRHNRQRRRRGDRCRGGRKCQRGGARAEENGGEKSAGRSHDDSLSRERDHPPAFQSRWPGCRLATPAASDVPPSSVHRHRLRQYAAAVSAS